MKGYRTIAFNAIMTVVMLGNLWGVFGADNPAPNEADVTVALDAVDTGITAAWGLGNVILRAVTDSPIFRKRT